MKGSLWCRTVGLIWTRAPSAAMLTPGSKPCRSQRSYRLEAGSKCPVVPAEGRKIRLKDSERRWKGQQKAEKRRWKDSER